MKKTVLRVISSCLLALLALGLFYLCSYAVLYILAVLGFDSDRYTGLYCVSSYGLIMLFLWTFWRITRQSEKFIYFKKTSPSQKISVVLIAIGLAGIVTIYMFGAAYLSKYLESLKEHLDEYKQTVDRYSDVPQEQVPLWDSIIYILTTFTLVPLCEEFLFRGIIMGQMRKIMPVGFAVLVQAIVFGLMHGLTLHIGYALICGIVMGLVYMFCDNFWMPVLIHSIFNFLGSSFSNILNLKQLGVPSDIRANISYTLVLVKYFFMFPAALAFVYLWYRYKKNKEDEARHIKEAAEAYTADSEEALSC
ncbi:MAG: CPBP family intramembrane metalloprotease [Clostridiales bacterium]|nr:CPBP family intramembrane metalloprotease [Clostridiales bacterium]